MTIFFEPLIDPQDYDAFRRIPRSDLPHTYDEWLYLLNQERANILITRGNSIRSLKVEPDEFARHCNSTGTACDLQSLRNFVAKKTGLG
ncbi:MAG: hypothetical protein JOY83_05365 [Alphaproteobacteria bacterium]|nr:hypothetical protein [Alphaproteobacteria bacterium]